MPLPFTPAIAPDVVHETIDGEAILINLATGTYFSLEGSAADAWALLARGADVDAAAAELAARHDADPDAVAAELVRLLGDLHAHGLVGPPPDPRGAPDPAALGTFAPPAVSVFTDMEEFLVIDPIHQVEHDRGWPHATGEA